MERVITEQAIEEFKAWLINTERCCATMQKYTRDLRKLQCFAGKEPIDKEKVLTYKKKLWDCGKYKISSINSFLVAANRFFKFMGWHENIVETYPVQEEIFRSDDKALSKEECRKMIKFAKLKGQKKLAMIIQVFCSTGVRVSELKFITAEAVKQGEAVIYNKGKVRTILFSDEVKVKLMNFMEEEGIKTGTIFLSSRGNPIDRSNLSKKLKELAREAKIDERKVYPHNFRYMFAQCFYQVCKDILKVSALLGHSNIKTTMNYLKTTKQECKNMLNQMKFIYFDNNV